MTNMIVVIPARLQSTRLPRKPLVDIGGKPMVQRTYERCTAVFAPESIYVATESEEIVEVCERLGIQTVMTRDDHLTGTDRVAEVASKIAANVYINVQGDEPLFDPGDLASLRDFAFANPEVIAAGYCPIHDEDEYLSPMVPKVLFDQNDKLLYMSRAPVPGSKDRRFRFGYRQVCAYSFPAFALRAFAEHPAKTPLEESEDIELLRLVELGHPVRMLPMSDRSIPVDLPQDVEKVLAALDAAG
jgi:3-deoxy-manno-octulosonate cytidylyltransferase (CMP-KDO synthetase)